jgi:hypothetical protein
VRGRHHRAMQWGWMLAGLLVSCGPVVVQEPTAHAPRRKNGDDVTVKLCNGVVYVNTVPTCVHEVAEGGYKRIEYRGAKVVSLTSINGAGEPVESSSRCARWSLTYEGDEVVEETCVDRAGRTRLVNHIQRKGDKWVERHLDAFGQPSGILHSDATVITLSRNERGIATAIAFSDAAGHAVLSAEGAHEFRFELDENGQRTRSCAFDAAGRPMLVRGSSHCLVNEFDRGVIVGVSHFGLSGEPVATKEGFHGVAHTLDARGFVVETRYVDVNGKPTSLRESKLSRVAKDLDEYGRSRVERYFDDQGAPAPNDYGCAAREIEYLGKTSLATKVTCLSADGEKRVAPGYAVTTATTYNERYDKIEIRFLDAAGQLFKPPVGYAIVRTKVDERGNALLVTHLDEHLAPAVEHGTGSHMIAYGYDELDRRIQTTYFDVKGLIAKNRDRFARVVTEYDAAGHLARHRYYDATGGALVTLEGFCVPFDKQGDGEGPADRNQATASTILAKARADIEKGMSVEDAYRVHLGVEKKGDLGFMSVKDGPSVLTEALEVGALSGSYEAVGGLCFLRRTDQYEKKLP